MTKWNGKLTQVGTWSALFLCTAICPAQQRGALYGVVRDAATQKPIEGVSLLLAPYAFGPGDQQLFPALHTTLHSQFGFLAKTDAEGKYRFEDLPAHRYCLRWKKDGYLRQPTDLSCQKTLVRTPGDRDQEWNLTLENAPSLRVRLTDDLTDEPIDDMQIIVENKLPSGRFGWTMCCWSRRIRAGEYEVQNPPPGKLYLRFKPDPTVKGQARAMANAYGSGYYPNVALLSEATPLELAPGENRVLYIRLRTGAMPEEPVTSAIQSKPSPSPKITIKGFVVTDGNHANKVDGYAILYFGEVSVKVKAGESFEAKIPPGVNCLAWNTGPGWIVSRAAYGELDVTHATFDPDGTRPLVVTLSQEYGAVKGTIRDGAAPTDIAWVVLVPDPIPASASVNSFPWTHLDEQGGYEFNYVPAGRYGVVPFYDDTLELFRELDSIEAHAKGSRDIIVKAGETISGLDFQRVR